MEGDKKAMKIIHTALCFGALIFILVLHYLIRPIDFTGLNMTISSLGFIALFIAASNVVFGNLIFQKRMKAIGTNQITSENIVNYRGAFILKWALLESAILVNAVIYFFANESPILILVALLLLLLLFTTKPKFS